MSDKISKAKKRRARRKEKKMKQFEAIELLSIGCSERETAMRLGVQRNTIRRWKKDPAFMTRVDEARRSLTSTFREDLEASCQLAIDALILAVTQREDINLAVRAADILLERAGINATNMTEQSLMNPVSAVTIEDMQEMVNNLPDDVFKKVSDKAWN